MIDIKDKDKILKFSSPIPESVNHYLDQRVIKKNGKNLVLNYPSAKNVIYKNKFAPYIKQVVKDAGWDKEITRGKHYYLSATIYFGRIDQDEQNYWKMPCDIMNEIVYIDDSMILTRCDRIYYTYNEELEPHIDFTLYPSDYIGIWDSQEEYDMFVEMCKECKNYKDGACKRLNDYMGYKITKDFDITSRSCLGFKEIKVVKEKTPKKKTKGEITICD